MAAAPTAHPAAANAHPRAHQTLAQPALHLAISHLVQRVQKQMEHTYIHPTAITAIRFI